MSIETDEWLATMRTSWKAGIDRDERETGVASAARLARTVVPENERPSRRAGELLALAACIVVCALGLMWLRHTQSTPAGFVHEIRADRAPDALPAEPSEEAAVVEEAPPAAPPALSATAPVPVSAPAKAKNDSETLPALPRPTPSSERARDEGHGNRMKRFELRIDRSWRRHAPPPPRRPRGQVHDL